MTFALIRSLWRFCLNMGLTRQESAPDAYALSLKLFSAYADTKHMQGCFSRGRSLCKISFSEAAVLGPSIHPGRLQSIRMSLKQLQPDCNLSWASSIASSPVKHLSLRKLNCISKLQIAWALNGQSSITNTSLSLPSLSPSKTANECSEPPLARSLFS